MIIIWLFLNCLLLVTFILASLAFLIIMSDPCSFFYCVSYFLIKTSKVGIQYNQHITTTSASEIEGEKSERMCL